MPAKRGMRDPTEQSSAIPPEAPDAGGSQGKINKGDLCAAGLQSHE